MCLRGFVIQTEEDISTRWLEATSTSFAFLFVAFCFEKKGPSDWLGGRQWKAWPTRLSPRRSRPPVSGSSSLRVGLLIGPASGGESQPYPYLRGNVRLRPLARESRREWQCMGDSVVHAPWYFYSAASRS